MKARKKHCTVGKGLPMLKEGKKAKSEQNLAILRHPAAKHKTKSQSSNMHKYLQEVHNKEGQKFKKSHHFVPQ